MSQYNRALEVAKELSLIVSDKDISKTINNMSRKDIRVNRILLKAAIKVLQTDKVWMKENETQFRKISNLTQCIRENVSHRSYGYGLSRVVITSRSSNKYHDLIKRLDVKGGWRNPVVIIMDLISDADLWSHTLNFKNSVEA